MTLKKWVYSFTLRTQKMREALGLSNNCYYCNVDIVIGDEVYSRNANSHKSKSKLYHKECAERVNII